MKTTTNADAERRRAGLRALLARYDLTPTELAPRLGMRRPNAIYNFLNGRTAALSLGTIETVLEAFPEFTFEELVGWPRRLSRA